MRDDVEPIARKHLKARSAQYDALSGIPLYPWHGLWHTAMRAAEAAGELATYYKGLEEDWRKRADRHAEQGGDAVLPESTAQAAQARAITRARVVAAKGGDASK